MSEIGDAVGGGSGVPSSAPVGSFSGTVVTDIAQVVTMIENDVKTLEADAVLVVQAVIAALKQGQFAMPLTQIAVLLKDAEAAYAALQADVNAVLPQNVKNFLASSGTLDSEISVPFANKTLTSVHFLGTKADLISKLAGGMPL